MTKSDLDYLKLSLRIANVGMYCRYDYIERLYEMFHITINKFIVNCFPIFSVFLLLHTTSVYVEGRLLYHTINKQIKIE